MNIRALHKLSYGLYVIGSRKGEQLNGQIANTVFQVTAEPPTVAVSINQNNLTHQFIKQSRVESFRRLPSVRLPLSLLSVTSASSRAGT